MNVKHVYIILLATGILPLSRTTIIKTWKNVNNNKKKSTPYLAVASDGGPGAGARQQSLGSGGGGHNVVRGPVVSKRPTALKTGHFKKSKPKPSIKENDEGETSKPDSVLKNISTKKAMTKLKKKFRSSGESVEVKPVPAGRAQFMIGQTKGITRPLNILYDSGCHSLLLKEGVQHELGKSVLKTKGPCVVNGVGNTSVKVNDEWLTTLELLDGSRQAMEGWTVDEVTAPLPSVDLSKAVKELKDDKPDDEKLQSMFVQLVAGGDCDILLGQLYNAIFPKAVHSLPNGLTIYELLITPHDAQVNSVIGGPHESFEVMAKQVGGASCLFSQLMATLDNYKSFGPPSVSRSLMPIEDEKIHHKEWKHDNHSEDLLNEVDDDENIREQSEEICIDVKNAVTNSRNENNGVAVVEDMKSDAEVTEDVKTMFEGSFLENSEAILDSLSKLAIAETDCKEATSLFVGTFVENYEDILENLDKLVDENGPEDASHVEKVIEGTEIKKNSKCEGSRYKVKFADDGETHEGKIDVQHKPRLDNTDTGCLSNSESPHNDEHSAGTVMKSGCVVSRVSMSKLLLPLLPIIQEKLLTLVYSIKMDLAEDVVADQTASADNFMVL